MKTKKTVQKKVTMFPFIGRIEDDEREMWYD